jgi:hypothetical protein
MTLIDRVRGDAQDAMRAGERERAGALRLVLSELQRAEKDGGADELTVLRRERKRRVEAADAFRGAGRADQAAAEEREAELITGYLPAELGDEELAEIVTRVIAETGAASVKDLGRVMGAVMAAVDGRADGSRVSARVKEALTA